MKEFLKRLLGPRPSSPEPVVTKSEAAPPVGDTPDYVRRAPSPPGGLDARLETLIGSHDLAYVALTSAAGEFLAEAGDPRRLRYAGIVSALLGPLGSARATYDSLEDQILPQGYGQGGDFAILDRPSAGLLLVAFGRANPDARRDAVAQYHWCKSVIEEFRREIGDLADKPQR